MSAAVPLNEADVHGLVDGHIEPGRRSDALRRLAGSPVDRAKVEAWRDQNELIRSAFLGVDKEPLPAPLKLIPPPNLQSVPASHEVGLIDRPMPRHKQAMVTVVAVLLLAAGIGGATVLMQFSGDTAQVVRLRGTVDDVLASRAAGAVDMDSGLTNVPLSETIVGALPTTTIPDLTATGFAFSSAETQSAAPGSMVFHYRNAAADRIVVSVARAPAGADSGPTQIGRSFSWRRGDTAFAIAGTVRPDRLRAMAALLQGAADP